MPAGRKTKLNDRLKLKMRSLVLQGHRVEEMAELSEIPIKTIQGWITRNYEGFADAYRGWLRERMLAKAEGNLEELLDMPVQVLEWEGKGETAEQVVVTSPALVKVKQDTAKFISETLGKKHYSKQKELEDGQGHTLINIEKQIINIANDNEPKTIEAVFREGATTDDRPSIEPIQEREGGASDHDPDPSDDVRADIQAILSSNQHEVPHEVRQELHSSLSDPDESSDVS